MTVSRLVSSLIHLTVCLDWARGGQGVGLHSPLLTDTCAMLFFVDGDSGTRTLRQSSLL